MRHNLMIRRLNVIFRQIRIAVSDDLGACLRLPPSASTAAGAADSLQPLAGRQTRAARCAVLEAWRFQD